MGLIQKGRTLHLEGDCWVEDGEALIVMLQAEPDLGLDLSACESLHTAVLQVILAFRPQVRVGPPAGGFLARCLASFPSPVGQATPPNL